MSNRPCASNFYTYVSLQQNNRQNLIDTLISLQDSSEEMFVKVYELRSLLQEVKATREEMEHMKNALNAAAKDWGVNSITEKDKKS